MTMPEINWDWGTAYDFFISLRVLHDSDRYGLRPSWAAGVRARITAGHREILEKMQSFLFCPSKWIHALPAPKDSDAVLWMLRQMPAAERLPTLVEASGVPPAATEVLNAVSARGEWTAEDQESLRAAYQPDKTPPRNQVLAWMLALFADSTESGDKVLAALQAYQQAFFTEEEAHIRPFLKAAVTEAKGIAAEKPLDELIEVLSRGVRLGVKPDYASWIFVPSYWISPLVSFERLSADRALFVFGGRPADVSLVPGDLVPDGLLRALKTLADPTRLRILRYLACENIPPAELARRLRLRAPTVTYHLNALRLAGLVYLTLEGKNERRYAARMGAVEEMYAGLIDFLMESSEDNDVSKDG